MASEGQEIDPFQLLERECLPKEQIVDVHCHIDDPKLLPHLPDLLSKAQEQGVCAIFGVSMNADSAQTILGLSEKYPIIRPFAAAHPIQHNHSVTREEAEQAIRFIRENHTKLAGIGECGLDFSPRLLGDNPAEAKEIQRWALSQFVSLSREFDLPLNVHSRSAGRPCIQVLQEGGARAVNMHAFDGSTKVAKQGIRSGYYFSVPPSVHRGPERQKQISQLPLDQLLVETDAPALGPIKMVDNHPQNLGVSVWHVGNSHKISYENAAKTTTENAKKFCPKAFVD